MQTPDRAPWPDDAEAVIPPGVKVTVCPPEPAPRQQMNPDLYRWSADKGDFFSDNALEHDPDA